MGYKVKPLNFVEDGDRWLTRRAEGYVITTHTVSPFWGVNDPHGNDLGVFDLLSDAIDAAQKDWVEFISHHVEET